MHNEYLEAIINLRSQISSRFVRRFIEYGNENINYRTEPRLLFQNMVPVFRLLDKKCPDFRTLTIFVRFMAAYFPTFFEMLDVVFWIVSLHVYVFWSKIDRYISVGYSISVYRVELSALMNMFWRCINTLD